MMRLDPDVMRAVGAVARVVVIARIPSDSLRSTWVEPGHARRLGRREARRERAELPARAQRRGHRRHRPQSLGRWDPLVLELQVRRQDGGANVPAARRTNDERHESGSCELPHLLGRQVC